MRILIAHDAPPDAAGEDPVAAEHQLLLSHGHEVQRLAAGTARVSTDPVGGLGEARQRIWSPDGARAMRAAIRSFRPDVVHAHDTLGALSPSIHWAAAQARVALVQTLHDHRLACVQGEFLRAGSACQDCLGRSPLPGVLRGCYGGSRTQSLVVAAMLATHRLLGTWERKVARFIALSQFSRGCFIDAGLPARRILVKPPFARAPLAQDQGTRDPKAPFLFAGPVTPVRGSAVLAQALQRLAAERCTVVGGGPGASALAPLGNVTILPAADEAVLSRLMHAAPALVLPGIGLEAFPLAVAQAFAHGLPVIASRIGALPELVAEGRTGLLFQAGDADDLARKLQWARDHPQEMLQMGDAARLLHYRRYSAQENHRQLLEIYNEAIAAPAA